MLRRLAKSEGGFGLVELLIAMVVMSIGITAIVAGYSSGILAVDRAKVGTTAGALADRQMEAYRQGSFAAVPTTRPRLRQRNDDDGRYGYWMQVDGSWSCAIGTFRRARRLHEHAREPPGQARDDHRPRRLGRGKAPLHRDLDLRLLDRLTNLFDPRNRHGCIRI